MSRNNNIFVKNILTLVRGTTIAQFIPLLISPILTRIYSPEEFGVLAIFIAVISILTPLINGRYELAIAIPKKRIDSISIFKLTIFINIIVSSLVSIAIIFFGNNLAALLNLSNSNWLYFIPISLLMIGLFNSLTYLFNRKKNFSILAKSKVLQSFSLSFFQLLFGFLSIGYLGLVSGYVFGQIIAVLYFLKNFSSKDYKSLKVINKSHLKKVSKEYSDFPKYSVITHSTESFSTNIPNLLISKFFGTQATGYYSLTMRTVSIPLALVGKSIGDVFLSTAGKQYREKGTCKDLYVKTFKILALLPLIPFILLYIFAEPLFAFVFGKDWGISGHYVQILIPAIYLQFIANPLAHMFVIAEKIKLELLIQMSIMIFSLTSFITGYYIFNSVEISLYLYSSVLIVKYLCFIYISYILAKKKRVK